MPTPTCQRKTAGVVREGRCILYIVRRTQLYLDESLWTALHAGYSLAGILEVFTIGLFFSWLLWRTGSLRVPIFCHALYNSLIVLVLRQVPLPT